MFLGAAAAATLRNFSRQEHPWAALRASFKPSVGRVSVEGVDEALARRMEADLAAGGPRPKQRWTADALARYPFLGSFDCRRGWTGRTVCRASLRTAVAAIAGGTRDWLDDQGVRFSPPQGYAAPAALPVVEPGRAGAKELSGLAAFLAARPSLSPPIVRVSYVSSQDGWRFKLEDGTTVLFGDMNWSSQKLERLGQVLSDARAEFPGKGRMTADLRYFEDGRILLRPVGAR